MAQTVDVRTLDVSVPRHVVPRALAHRPHLALEVGERVVAPGQIELRGFDDQQRRGAVVKEEVVVRLVQLPDVLVVERRAASGSCARALAQALAQHVGRRLQVDHEIGRRHVLRQQLVEPLIDEQLVVVEVQVRVDLVALEQVVADGQLAEEIALPQRGLLPVARRA